MQVTEEIASYCWDLDRDPDIAADAVLGDDR